VYGRHIPSSEAGPSAFEKALNEAANAGWVLVSASERDDGVAFGVMKREKKSE